MSLPPLITSLSITLSMLQSPNAGVSHSQVSPHSASSNSSRLPRKCSYLLMAPVASGSDKQALAVTLWICLSLQTSRWWFACQPQFSEESKKSYWFSVCSLFFLRDRSDNFQELKPKEVQQIILHHGDYSCVRWFPKVSSPSAQTCSIPLARPGLKKESSS